MKNLSEMVKMLAMKLTILEKTEKELGYCTLFDDNRLRGYQAGDVWYLHQRGSCLVLNDPRTGKTPTMISVMKALETKRNLVVCPLH
jgi:hypothetical protein